MTEWTKEPPKEAEWYWIKQDGGNPVPCYRDARGYGWSHAEVLLNPTTELWWPIPIQPPEEKP